MATVTARHRKVQEGDILLLQVGDDRAFPVKVYGISGNKATVQHTTGTANKFNVALADLHPFTRVRT